MTHRLLYPDTGGPVTDRAILRNMRRNQYSEARQPDSRSPGRSLLTAPPNLMDTLWPPLHAFVYSLQEIKDVLRYKSPVPSVANAVARNQPLIAPFPQCIWVHVENLASSTQGQQGLGISTSLARRCHSYFLLP